MITSQDYNEAIASAAKEMMVAQFAEKSEKDQKFLQNKLAWMIDAEKFGWNPNDFQKE